MLVGVSGFMSPGTYDCNASTYSRTELADGHGLGVRTVGLIGAPCKVPVRGSDARAVKVGHVRHELLVRQALARDHPLVSPHRARRCQPPQLSVGTSAVPISMFHLWQVTLLGSDNAQVVAGGQNTMVLKLDGRRMGGWE